MKRLEIKPETNSPHIVLDADKSVFIIEGKSFPEDSKQFFHQVLEWFKVYKSTNPKSVELTVNLFYLSSSSIISLKQIFLILMECKANGSKVTINWCYDEDDDDIKKTGEDYMRISNLNFVFKENA